MFNVCSGRLLSSPKIAGILALAVCAFIVYHSTIDTLLEEINSGSLKGNLNKDIFKSRSFPRYSWNVSKHEVPSMVNSQPKMPPARIVLGERSFQTAFLTIGIATVSRGGKSYLQQVLDSLFTGATSEELSQIIIVIFLGDFNATNRHETAQMLSTRYKRAIENGTLIVTDADAGQYPPLHDIVNGYNDSAQRVKWRTKQVVDFSILWRFSAPLSSYYLQLEDDCVAAAGYVSSIRGFIENQTKPWTCLHFSTLGFIGKLFRSVDIPVLAHIAEYFYTLHPVDYILGYYLSLSGQPGEKSVHIPTLFHHVGQKSSLKGKIQFAVDEAVLNTTKRYVNAGNPAAKFSTNLTIWEELGPQFAYGSNPGVLWAKDVAKNQYVSLSFTKPQELKRVVVATGFGSKNRDFLEHGVLEASMYSNRTNLDCSSFIQIAQFVNGTADTGDIDKGFVNCLRVKVTESQGAWLVISEIAVFVR